ncbi:MAG: hypothetical protein JNL81_07950 [Hyphomonadaceae bacterium]|nr:hypothetical protein [Hyphomonadaceae bacterium]
MRLSRTVLIALGASAVLLGVAAIAGPAVLDRMGGGGGGGRITIAIATSETLEAFYRRAERNVEEANRVADEGIEQVSASRDAQSDTTAHGETTPAEGAASNTGQRGEASANRDMIEALIVTALDELGSELTEEMSQNERFAVTEPSALLGALRDLRDRRETGNVPLLQRLMFWREQRSSPEGDAESSHLVVSSQSESADLASAGDQLNVRYILFVALAPDGLIPSFTYDANDSGAGTQMTVEPRVIYRVFDVRTQTVVLAGLEPLRPPVSVPYTVGNGASARQQLVNAMNERVARVVTRKLTDALAPARLVASGGDLVINRGAVDGVRKDDIYPVESEGAVVRDAVADGGSGGSLGRRRTASGQVQVVSVEDSYAVVRVLDGEPSAQDVVVLERRTRGGGQSASNSGGGAVPLGARAIREQQRGARPRAAIAVGRINVELLEPQNWRRPNNFASDLSRRVGDGLTQDRRITIVSRMDLSRTMDERGVAAASRGDYDTDLAEGLATADYQVIGEVRLTSRRVGQTVSVGGQSRETNVRPRLFAEGTFRILDTDGRQIDSVPIRVERAGASTDAGAVNELMNEVGQVASAQILIALFPIEVASVSGDRIVLTRGSEAGLRVGARLRVYRIGEPVRDQYTEDVISEGARTHLGDLVVIDAPEGSATARFAARSFGLQQNDLVEISTSQAPAASATPRPAQTQQQQQQDPTGGVRF